MLAQEQWATVGTKIGQLEALRTELKRMVAAGCRRPAGDCRMIETLAEHYHCSPGHDGLSDLDWYMLRTVFGAAC
jgi:hypothetical protein